MSAAGNRAALMRERPLNNAMLTTTTHSKLREALDGTVPSSPNKGTSVRGQLWEQGERTIVGEPVTSALNACSWQSGHINERMTPEQCHANHYHSQQVEGSAGWDRHSSGDLRNRQMDGQDEENKRIYNQGDFTKKGTIRKTPGSSIGGVSGVKKKKSFSAENRGRALTFPPVTLLTIQLSNDFARLLKASSQRPSSQARFSTKFIVLGLLGLGLFTSTNNI